MNLPREFVTETQARRWSCTAHEGVFWAHGQFWLARGSPYNPSHRRQVLLLGCYDRPRPEPPPPDVVDRFVVVLADAIPAHERVAFEIQAAILRATAKEYHAA